MSLRTLYRTAYVLLDFALSFGVWFGFWLVRRSYFSEAPLPFSFPPEEALKHGLAATLWVLLYAAHGLYANPFRKSRLREQQQVFRASLLGAILLFFASFVDDQVTSYRDFREMLMLYFLLQAAAVGLGRALLSSWIKRQLVRGKIGLPTLLIGQDARAQRLLQQLERLPDRAGLSLRGYLATPHTEAPPLLASPWAARTTEQATPPEPVGYPLLGPVQELPRILAQEKPEVVILALETADQPLLANILEACEHHRLQLYTVPDMYDFLIGSVRMSGVRGVPLVEIYPSLLPRWQQLIKRGVDIAAALLVLVLGAPVFLLLALLIRLDSRGPILYRQERMGRNRKPFRILKFRSMYVDAEQAGPQLSRSNDPRITRMGRFLRKSHFDELPQFWNVLLGEMSLVGPRPERPYFIEQIVAQAPEYLHLLQVRPGITSWGQVQYGYASTVDEMVERLRYDLLYIENMSLALDFKILAYTVLEVLQAKGK